MPHTVQYRIVKDFKWYNPRTWRKTHQEYRYLWDIDQEIYPDEFDLIVRSNCDNNGRGRWVRMDDNPSAPKDSTQKKQPNNE